MEVHVEGEGKGEVARVRERGWMEAVYIRGKQSVYIYKKRGMC